MDNNRDIITSDYIGLPPSWISRYGNLLLLLFLCSIISLTFFISYNDVISSKITITTSIPPAYIPSRKNGTIKEMRVRSGDTVYKGQILAILDNSANTVHTLNVLSNLKGKYDTISNTKHLHVSFPLDLNLGNLQREYNDFVTAYQIHINFLSHKRGKKIGIGLQKQVSNQKYALNNQRALLVLSQKKLNLAQKGFNKQEKLYLKGVISQNELEAFENTLITAKEKVQSNIQNLSLLDVERSKLFTESGDNTLENLEQKENYISNLRASRQELISAVNEWKRLNIFTSPLDGQVSVFDVWEKHQNVKEDEYIFSVVPKNKNSNFIGKLKVPIRNSGKIRKGQKVIIKLDNYPYREWGSLQGKTIHISQVPKKGEEQYYSLYVDVPNLSTSFGKNILFKHEMTGRAEVILEEVSLIGRIFYQFRALWE